MEGAPARGRRVEPEGLKSPFQPEPAVQGGQGGRGAAPLPHTPCYSRGKAPGTLGEVEMCLSPAAEVLFPAKSLLLDSYAERWEGASPKKVMLPFPIGHVLGLSAIRMRRS